MTEQRDVSNKITGGIFFSTVIQGRDISLQLPPQITPALSGLPPGTPAFTGREADLRALLDVLAPSLGDEDVKTSNTSRVSTVVIAAVGGLAGIGKTELAVQAAHVAVDNGWFPGGVLFVDLFGYDPALSVDSNQALEGFLRAVGIPGEHIPSQTQDRARLYASVLAAYAREGRRILVVIDNAASHEQAKTLLPTDSANAAIVTSRDTLGLLDVRLLRLDALTVNTAVQMLDGLLRIASLGDNRVTRFPDDAARIAQLCGKLPLAVRIVAALLRENLERPLAEMAAELDDERTRLDELTYADSAVRAAFYLSYRRLDTEHARLFRLFAINPGPEISTQATVALAEMEQVTTRHALEALARAHLIEQGSSYGRWRMHDLVRLYSRELSEAEADTGRPEQALIRLVGYYLKATFEADQHLRALPITVVPADFTDRYSALAWLDIERPNLVGALALAINTGRDQAAMVLSLTLGEYLSWRQRFDDLIVAATVGHDAARRLGDRANEAVALTTLGFALTEMRQFRDAADALYQAAVIFGEINDRDGEGKALVTFGNVLTELRWFKEALDAYQSAVLIFRMNGDQNSEGNALDCLGTMLTEVGSIDQAITVHKQALGIFRDTSDWNGYGKALNNLGNVLRRANRIEEAITAHHDAAEIFGQIGNMREEGKSLNNLGGALGIVHQQEEAISVLQRAVTIFQEIGDLHNEALAQYNLELEQAAHQPKLDAASSNSVSSNQQGGRHLPSAGGSPLAE
jgi:tetratricopeptide (TPR) repeat protein